MSYATDKLITLAKAEVGTRETGNNAGKRIIEYQKATWLAPAAWPWCAAFTCWLLREALKDAKFRNELSIILGRPLSHDDAETWRCKDASAFGWEKWANVHGVILLTENNKAKAGDFVTFDFSHIGLVIADQSNINDPIQTIEGNTNSQGAREGDGVWKKTRDHKLVRRYIRIFNK